jgi:hypothetical protein
MKFRLHAIPAATIVLSLATMLRPPTASADVQVSYTVDDKALKGAAAGTM